MKKLIIILTSVTLLSLNGCLLKPNDCEIRIASYKLNLAYTFKCNREEAQEHIETMQIECLKVSDTKYHLGQCNGCLSYDWDNRDIHIHLKLTSAIN